jgi:diketogulonate reductase-like aldo/keto reductase
VVQNRCLAAQQWDASVRSLCQEAEIEYQGFWLLTGNRDVVSSPAVSRIAERHGKTAPQIIYRFAQGLGITPLSGTTNRQHMQEALEAAEIELGEEERREITALG